MHFSLVFLLCVICFVLGSFWKKIFIGLRKYIIKKQKETNTGDKKSKNKKDDDLSEGEEYDFDDADLKMVFLVREDLKLGAGKIAAQVAHAAVGLYEDITSKDNPYNVQALEHWTEFGAKKIVLRVNSLEELKKLHSQCKLAKIPSTTIADAGHTQVDPGTITVLGIGPDSSEKIDKLTGTFKLMR